MRSQLCFVAAWLAWSGLAAAGGAPEIQIVSPGAAPSVGGPVLVRIRVRSGGRAFTEQGQNRWCQATVRNEAGKAVAQVTLRDNGREFDPVTADGEWTAPARLELPAGAYSLQIQVHAGETTYSARGRFVVSTSAATAAPQEPAVPPGITERLDRISKEIRAPRPVPDVSTALWICAAALCLSAFSTWMALGNRRALPTSAKPVENAPDPAPAPAPRWKPLFQGLETIAAAAAGAEQHLSGLYQSHRRFEERQIKLLRDFISVSRALESAHELDADLTDALRANLNEALSDAGVYRWDPKVGEPAPSDAEQQRAKGASGPSLTVTRVLSSGFRLREGEEWLVLVRPVVEVIPASGKESL